jgi:hypothetical protein
MRSVVGSFVEEDVLGSLEWRKAAAEQSLAADGPIACFSSNFVPSA